MQMWRFVLEQRYVGDVTILPKVRLEDYWVSSKSKLYLFAYASVFLSLIPDQLSHSRSLPPPLLSFPVCVYAWGVVVCVYSNHKLKNVVGSACSITRRPTSCKHACTTPSGKRGSVRSIRWGWGWGNLLCLCEQMNERHACMACVPR